MVGKEMHMRTLTKPTTEAIKSRLDNENVGGFMAVNATCEIPDLWIPLPVVVCGHTVRLRYPTNGLQTLFDIRWSRQTKR